MLEAPHQRRLLVDFRASNVSEMGIFTTHALVLLLHVSAIVQIAVTEGDTSVTGSEIGGDGVLMPGSAARFSPMSSAVETNKLGYFFSLSLSSAFPEDLEVSDYCLTLLRIFGERYVNYVNCSVSYARPVKMCEKCYASYRNLAEIYRNVSADSVSFSNHIQTDTDRLCIRNCIGLNLA